MYKEIIIISYLNNMEIIIFNTHHSGYYDSLEESVKNNLKSRRVEIENDKRE